MNTLKELGDQWERKALAGVMEKRDRIARSAALCKEGGDYAAQMRRTVAMYDRMIAAASAQPVSAGLTDEEALSIFYKEIGGEGHALYEVTPGNVIAFSRALLSAAQRDSQPIKSNVQKTNIAIDGDSQAVASSATRKLVEQCRDALAEELAAWKIDPPLEHVQRAHNACVAWLAEAPAAKPVEETPADARDAALDEVHKFLLGEGPLDGLWYGDVKPDAPTKRYWWRNPLRAAIAASREA